MAKIWNRRCFDFKCENCNGTVSFTQQKDENLFEINCPNICCRQKYRIHMDTGEAVPFGEPNPSKFNPHDWKHKQRQERIEKEEIAKQYDCLDKRLIR